MKKQFKKSDIKNIRRFLSYHKKELVGSAIFTSNQSWISKLVSKFSKCCSDDVWTPSHIGSLILVGGEINIFDMKPPKATITPLKDYLETTEDDFEIVLREFDLDIKKFSYDICKKVNNHYGYISAIQTLAKVFNYPYREHCSEIHLLELQAQGLFTNIDANKITPTQLRHLLIA